MLLSDKLAEKLSLKVVELAVKVGGHLKKNFGEFKKATRKKGNHFGILEDKTADWMWQEELIKILPNAGYESEEIVLKTERSEFSWVVDAIDGTTNYAKAVPIFATQCALLYRGQLLLSVIYWPIYNQIYTAIRGGGALLNNRKISVSVTNKFSEAVITIAKSAQRKGGLDYTNMVDKLVPIVRTLRNFGSAAIELAYVSSGVLDLWVGKNLNHYDYLPGSLLIEEAGGRCLIEEYEKNHNLVIMGNDQMVNLTHRKLTNKMSY